MTSTKERLSLPSSFRNFATGFKIDPEDFKIEPITTGFLHRSFSLTCESNGAKYVFQELSPIFDIEAINVNLKLFEEAQAKSAHFLPEYWQPVRYLNVLGSDDKIYYDEEGNAWRAMIYVPGKIKIFDRFSEVPDARRSEIAYSLGEAIAIFGKILTLIPQEKWQEPLPNFHKASYHFNYLKAILNGEEVVLSLSHDLSRRVRLNREFYQNFAERITLLLDKIEERKILISGLDQLGVRITHGDLKINNAVFRQDRTGSWRCVCLIDLDTIQKGGVLDDIADALRSAGNPAGEQPGSLSLVKIDQKIVDNLIDGYLSKISELYGEGEASRLRPYCLSAYAQFLLMQGMRFLADSLVGNRYFRLNVGEREDLNLYRAEVQFKALEELERTYKLVI